MGLPAIDQSAVVFGSPMLPDPARYTRLLGEALGSVQLTNVGALHMRLEKSLTEAQAAGDAATLVSSGTTALILALMLGQLPAGSEVITPALGFAATAQVIGLMGLRPVFADVDPEYLTLDPLAVERAISPMTSAILSVHFLGVPSDVHALDSIARSHGLWLVHDAAHAFGVDYEGVPIGHHGDVSAFSLHATKVLHTCEGGYIVSREEPARALRRMRNFGLEQGLPVGPGLNGKMSELHAAMGLALLPDLAAEVAARKRLRRDYDAALSGLPGIGLHGTRPGAGESIGYYTLRLDPELRLRLHMALAGNGILARDHFPLLCGPGTHWAGAGIVTAGGDAALTPALSSQTLCLPFHGRVGPAARARIVDVIASVAREFAA